MPASTTCSTSTTRTSTFMAAPERSAAPGSRSPSDGLFLLQPRPQLHRQDFAAARLGENVMHRDGDVLGAQQFFFPDFLALLFGRGAVEVGTDRARLDQRYLDAVLLDFFPERGDEALDSG